MFCFAPGMGPMPWTINSEIYPLWARSLGNSLATSTNWALNLLVSMTFLTLTETITKQVSAKPSLKIGSVNKAFLFWYWQRLKNIFFRNKTVLFFKRESLNFQHLFEKEFRETSQSFNSIRQPIEKIKITIVWISWMSWNFVRFHEI